MHGWTGRGKVEVEVEVEQTNSMYETVYVR